MAVIVDLSTLDLEEAGALAHDVRQKWIDNGLPEASILAPSAKLSGTKDGFVVALMLVGLTAQLISTAIDIVDFCARRRNQSLRVARFNEGDAQSTLAQANASHNLNSGDYVLVIEPTPSKSS